MRVIHSMWFIAATLILAVPIARAQKGDDARALEGATTAVTSVINLTHQDAYHIANVLNKLDLPVRAAAVGQGKLLVRGQRGEIQHVLDDLLPKIDTPPVSGSEKTAFIPLGGRSPSGLMTLLDAVKTDSRSRYAVDPTSNTLVARATEGELSLVREMLKAVDLPTRSLTLQFSFIRGVIGDHGGSTGPGLPEVLSAVGRTLRANGLGRLSLLAPMIVVAEEGEHFAAESALRPKQDPGDAVDELTFSVRGQVEVQSDDIAKLSIQAQMEGHYAEKADGEGHGAWFEAETTLSAKFGTYVILAASPSSTADGDAVALAVRITRTEDQAD